MTFNAIRTALIRLLAGKRMVVMNCSIGPDGVIRPVPAEGRR